MEWAQVLVIILSVFLALFLLLSIVLVALLINVTIKIKHVTNSAQRTAEGIERTVGGMRRITSPMFLVHVIKKSLRRYKREK